MKLGLFTKILIILGIAAIGLFFAYNNGYFNNHQTPYPNSPQNSENEAKNEPSNAPQGDSKIKKQIKVDLGLQKMYLFENGQIKREYPISSGKLETPTPTGKFRVIYKAPMVYSKIGVPSGSCWLPFWVGFTNDGKYGFHEVPICEEERVGIKEIGKPVSAGCIRLKQGDAEEFYNWAEIDTPVEIYAQ
jgi:lipoprotein-anchoring transpeptidase ErfK/SrfK